jgi:AcrR family transcriptional regulator
MQISKRVSGVKCHFDAVKIRRPITLKSNRATGEGFRIPTPRIRKPKRPATYHHGSLHSALLQAAERILERYGIQELSIRAAAREAGVSHSAPKHHFGDLTGLLSELAAVGFDRLTATMEAAADKTPAATRFDAIGQVYVAFARMHSGLFLLMFRSERLDILRPALRAAMARCRDMLADAVIAEREEHLEAAPTISQVAGMVAAWSLVHGFSVLLLEGRLNALVAMLPSETSVESLLENDPRRH